MLSSEGGDEPLDKNHVAYPGGAHDDCAQFEVRFEGYQTPLLAAPFEKDFCLGL
jgi:hypothetical protein